MAELRTHPHPELCVSHADILTVKHSGFGSRFALSESERCEKVVKGQLNCIPSRLTVASCCGRLCFGLQILNLGLCCSLNITSLAPALPVNIDKT